MTGISQMNTMLVMAVSFAFFLLSGHRVSAAQLVTCTTDRTCEMSGNCTTEAREIQLVMVGAEIIYVRRSEGLLSADSLDRVAEDGGHIAWRDGRLMNSVTVSPNRRFIWLQSSDFYRAETALENTTTGTGNCEAGW